MQAAKKAEFIYKPLRGKFFVIIICAAVFFLTFILNFPIERNIKAGLSKVFLTIIPNCPISFGKVDTVLLPPGLKFQNLQIPGRCLNSPTSLTFNNIDLSIVGFDWILFSPVFSFDTNYKRSNIKGMVSASTSAINLRLDESILDLGGIAPFLPQKLPLSGKLNISSTVEIADKKLYRLNINAFSKNLKLGPTQVAVMNLPGLNFGNFQIRATTPTTRRLVIEDFILGSPDKPLHAFFKGPITLNQKNLRASSLNLIGQFKFSKELKDELVVVESFVEPYKKDDGYYHMKLGGQLHMPTPSKIP